MIDLRNVTKTFQTQSDEVCALNGVNLNISQGELVVLKGRSGSGKSTILSLIAALSKPTSGEVIVKKEHIAKLSDDFASAFRLRHIGFIFQHYNLLEQLSVYENVLAPLIPLQLSNDEVERRIANVLKTFHLEGKKEQQVRSLSGGEQQRVAIARALVNDPNIVLADEPTANLDAVLANEFVDLLKNLKDSKRTILLATHDPIFWDLDIVDRIVELDGGRVC